MYFILLKFTLFQFWNANSSAYTLYRHSIQIQESSHFPEQTQLFLQRQAENFM